jgi:hypothetical protein
MAVTGGSWSVAQGKTYRLRLIVGDPRVRFTDLGWRTQIADELDAAGFPNARVFLDAGELPVDWIGVGAGTAHPPQWNAWAEVMWPSPAASIAPTFNLFAIARVDDTSAPIPQKATNGKSEAAMLDTRPTRPDVKLTGDHSWAFYEKLVAIGQKYGWKPIGMLSVMQSEAGMRADPPHNGPARGIIQFEPDILRELGWRGTPDDFAASHDAEAQLPWVEAYYAGWRDVLPPGSDALAFYAIGLAPGLVRRRKINLLDVNSLIVGEQDPEGFGWIVTDNLVFAEGTAPNRAIFVRGFKKRFDNVLTGARWLEAKNRLAYVERSGAGLGPLAIAGIGLGIGAVATAAYFAASAALARA